LANRIRVTASLVEASTGRSLWSGNYDRDASGIFDVQDELVHTIVATLGGRVTAESTREARRRPPSSLAAYELALRANALDWEEANTRAEAKTLLRQALALDPDYAAAHSLLAAILVQELVELHAPAGAILEEAQAHARRAVELDEGDSSHHSIIGWIHQLNGRYEEAETCIARALELNPGNTYAMSNRGTLATLQGRPDEGIAWLERTARSDPYFNSAWIHEETALAHFTARRYAESLDMLRKSPRRSFICLAFMAATLAMLDREQEARAAVAELRLLRPACTVAMLSRLYPFRHEQDRTHFEEALKSAGLPQ
jgi:Flp pilus assembly protein TadD